MDPRKTTQDDPRDACFENESGSSTHGVLTTESGTNPSIVPTRSGSDARLCASLEDVQSSSSCTNLTQNLSIPSVSTASTSEFTTSFSYEGETVLRGGSHRRTGAERSTRSNAVNGVSQSMNSFRSEEDVYLTESELSTSFSQTLPMCPADQHCMDINDPLHQNRYMHTCKLFPCYHAHLAYHVRLFRHVPGQGSLSPEDSLSGGGTFIGSNTSSLSSTFAPNENPITIDALAQHLKNLNPLHDESALIKVPETSSEGKNVSICKGATNNEAAIGGLLARDNSEESNTSAPATGPFSKIGPAVLNATPLEIRDQIHEMQLVVHADWSALRLHTLRRYLQKKVGIQPQDQELVWKGVVLDDDVSLMSELLGKCEFVADDALILRTCKAVRL